MPREILYDAVIRDAFDVALCRPDREDYLSAVLEGLAARLVQARIDRSLDAARLRLADEGDYWIRRRRASYWVPVRRAFWAWVTAWGMDLR